MTQNLFLRYGTDRDWADYKRRKSREIQERTTRRERERIHAEESCTRAGAEREQEPEGRRTWTAGILGSHSRRMLAGNADTEPNSEFRGTGKGGAAAPPRISVSATTQIRDLHTGGPVPVSPKRRKTNSRSSVNSAAK